MATFQTSDGLTLYFEDSGNGKPMLCLAGLTRNCRDFDFLAPHLTGHRMIAMDYRGRGRSDHDATYANYNVMREAQDAVELLDHLGLDKVTVIGTSRGGLNAMVLSAAHRDRLAGVVLNDVGPEVSADGIARIVAYVGKPPTAKTLEEAVDQQKTMLGPQFPGLPDDHWRKLAEGSYAQSPDGLSLRYDANLGKALAEQVAEGPPPDLWPLFGAMQGLPVGAIRGENSDILRADVLDRMQAALPGLITGVVPNRGHAPFLDEPEALAVIRAVLESA